MRKICKQTIGVFLSMLLLYSTTIYAQTTYVIKGSIIDSMQSKPLAGASITVLNKNQSSTVSANTSGIFQLFVKDTGTYTMEYSFSGYAKKVQAVKIITAETVLGTIALVPLSATLKGVTVTAKQKLVEQMDDKIVYNAELDPLAKAQSAIDILRRVPFISVDGQDNIRVNGQTNFRVLLNGRETAMFAQNVNEALQGFPGTTITKIEVITNPSAKYDAEGIGGIINIITKKKVEGYNGSVSSWQTTINQHIFNTNFNAKMGKLGVAINYGTRSGINIPSSITTSTVPTTTAFYRSRLLEGERKSNSFWNFGNGELSWAVDTLHTFSFYGNVSGGNSKQSMALHTSTLLNNVNDPLVSTFDQSNKREYPTNTIGTDFIKKFHGQPEKEFSVRVNAELGESNSFLESVEYTPNYNRFISNNSVATNKQYTLQSDYIQPLTNDKKLELGARVTLRRATSDFQSLLKYSGTDAFKLNPSNTDNFQFLQDVYSGYASYSFKIKTYSIRAGLRVEHTAIDGNFQSAKTFAKNSYTNLLPNLQISKRVKEVGLVLSYNQRLQRPYISYLNPFVDNNDSLNLSFGNPDLDAQTIHTVTLQSRLQKRKTFMGLTFSGSYSNNMIVNLVGFNTSTGVRSSTYENVGRDLLFSVNGNINTQFGEKWNYYANVNFQYRIVKNRRMLNLQNSGIGGNTSTGVSYTINKKFTLNNYIGFEQAIIDLQSKPNTIPFCGTGVNYQVVPSKLRIGLMAQNYFAKYYDYKTVITGPSFETVQTAHNLMGKMVLTVNWNFGKLKEKVSKKVGVTNDDLLGQ